MGIRQDLDRTSINKEGMSYLKQLGNTLLDTIG
jgi:hypothetical protein